MGIRKRKLSDKWHDLVRAQQAQFLAEMARLDTPYAHLVAAPVDSGQAGRFIEHKRAPLQRCVSLGAKSRWARLPGVVRETMRGDYWRYGTGGRSVLRDLLRRG